MRTQQSGVILLWIILWLAGMAAVAYWGITRTIPALEQHFLGQVRQAVNSDPIRVSVSGHEATLSGLVVDENERVAAVRAAEKVPGIRAVIDQLTLSTANIDTQNAGNKAEKDPVDVKITENLSVLGNSAQITASTLVETNNQAAANLSKKIRASTEANNLAAIASPDNSDAPDEPNAPVNEKSAVVTNTTRLTEQAELPTESIGREVTLGTPDEAAELSVVSPTQEPDAGSPTAIRPVTGSTQVAQPITKPAASRKTGPKPPSPKPPADPPEAVLNTSPNPADASSSSSNLTPPDQVANPQIKKTLPSLRIKISNSYLTISGQLAEGNNVEKITRAAMSIFDLDYLSNSVQQNKDILPATWLDPITAFLPELKPLNNAGIAIIEQQITLSGDAPNMATQDKIVTAALSHLSEYSLVEQIKIVKPEALEPDGKLDRSGTEAKIPTKSADTPADKPTDNPTTLTRMSARPESALQQTDTELGPAENNATDPKGALRAAFEKLPSSKILFKSGRAILARESRAVLDQITELLRKFPDVSVRIDGHTDSPGSTISNLRLSQARANMVRDYLIERDIDALRLSASGFGETKPIASNSTKVGRALNRRIEFNF